MQNQWKVYFNNCEHTVSYQGLSRLGMAKLLLDGMPREYAVSAVDGVGYARFHISEHSFLLSINKDGTQASLIFGGYYLQDSVNLDAMPPSSQFVSAADNENLQKSIKSNQNSFLSIIAFTLVNMVLILINASIYFPFSIFVPQLVMYMVKGSDSVMVGIVISAVIAGVYSLLLILSFRKAFPVGIALALFVVDSLILLIFALGDFSGMMFDLAFHAWVVFCLVGLLKSRLKYAKELREEVTAIALAAQYGGFPAQAYSGVLTQDAAPQYENDDNA